MAKKKQLTVERAAIQAESGAVFSVPQPGRHHNVIALMVEAGQPTPITGVQGFVLSDGSFADRDRSKEVAEAAGQRRRIIADVLTSEELW